MKISGIQKTSLIDYPDYISTVLFTQGCNMDCPYCHNPELIPHENDSEYMNLDYFWEYLDKRVNLIDGITITGGEPLIQPSIYDLISKIKEYNLLVKLDTNGTNYNLLKKLIDDNLVDYVAMDIKGPIEEYDKFCGIKISNTMVKSIEKSKDIIINSNIDYELRTTVVPKLHKKDDMKKIANFISNTEQYFIQNFRSEKVNKKSYQKARSFSEKELNDFLNIFQDKGIQAKLRS
jgi:pyruvate formate lyase activating enzyme